MLSTLPLEILLLITSLLEKHNDILNLASCNHALHALLHHHAFTKLTLDSNNIHQQSRLAHTLALNSRCAQAVRTLHFDQNHLSHAGVKPDDKLKYDRTIILPVLNSRFNIPASAVTQWEHDLTEELDPDAWTAVLLILVADTVEDLGLEFHYLSFYVRKLVVRGLQQQQSLGGSNIKSSPKPVPLFPRLRKLNARWWDTENGLPTSYVLPFFHLPSLRMFSGVMMTDGSPWDARDLRRELPPPRDGDYDDDDDDEENQGRVEEDTCGFSGVTHINLSYSNSEAGFPDLIRACRGLVSFVYEHGSCGGYDELAPSKVYTSLCDHKASLEELAICYDRWSDGCGDDRPEFIGSLAEFVVLKKVRVLATDILVPDGDGGGWRMPMGILPPSLQSLMLERFDMDVSYNAPFNAVVFMQRIKDLRGAVLAQCPDLMSLRVIIHERHERPQEDGWPLYSRTTGCALGDRCAVELVGSVAEDVVFNEDHSLGY
ncbi:hypothetical protein BJX64DRAFT_265337 [Aspergillus heterothallicus]